MKIKKKKRTLPHRKTRQKNHNKDIKKLFRLRHCFPFLLSFTQHISHYFLSCLVKLIFFLLNVFFLSKCWLCWRYSLPKTLKHRPAWRWEALILCLIQSNRNKIIWNVSVIFHYFAWLFSYIFAIGLFARFIYASRMRVFGTQWLCLASVPSLLKPSLLTVVCMYYIHSVCEA